ncbi:MAG: RNase P subunit p30 family protein [Candidatus Sigynarchaeota archaeon]
MLIEPRVAPSLSGGANEGIGRWIARARSVGYDGFVMEIPNNDKFPGWPDIQREVQVEALRFTIYTRKTLLLDDRRSVKTRLAGIRGRSRADVICVRSSSMEVLNFVAKDSRVDIIRLETQDEINAFNDGIASLAGQNGTFIELPFSPLVHTRGASRSKFIRSCNKILETCNAYHARLLFSSDAERLVDVKNAWQKAIVLQILLDAVSKQIGREIAIKNPTALIERCKGKKDALAVVSTGMAEDDPA